MGLNDRPVSNVPRSRGLNEAGRGGLGGRGGKKRETGTSHLNFQVHNTCNSPKNETTKSMTHTKKHRNTSKIPLFIL